MVLYSIYEDKMVKIVKKKTQINLFFVIYCVFCCSFPKRIVLLQ